MTHEDIKILISAYIDGELSSSEKTIVEEHLSSCTECQKEYNMYKAISSSLSKWSDENLSPDEEIKVQRRFEQRREPMFTKRTLMTLGTTLALTIIVGSVVQTEFKRSVQGRLKSAADDLGDQYSDTFQKKEALRAVFMARASTMAAGKPYYLASSYNVDASNRRLGAGVMMQQTMAGAAGVEALKTVNAANMAYPPTILQSQAQSIVEPDRKIIKNANITLKVDNAEKAQTALEALVARYNGVVGSLNIIKSDDGSRQGVMQFSVPPEDLDKILPELRKLGEVQSENQTSSDVTNQFSYIQRQLDHYMGQRENLRKLLKKNTQDIENNTYVQNQLTDVENNIDNLQSTMKILDDQSFMSTVTVNFYDTVKPEQAKPVSFKDKLAASLKDNIKTTLKYAYEIGISSFSGIFIVLSFLLQIAVWALLFWGIYLIVRRFFKK